LDEWISIVNGKCTNDAGLTTNAASLIVKLDKTAPTDVVLTPSGEEGTNGWFIDNVTIKTTGVDDISGVTCTSDQYQTEETTGAVFNGSCTNGAGLTTNAAPLTVKLDKTPPEVIITTPTDGGKYTFKQTIIANWSASDEISGIDNTKTSGTKPSGSPIDTTLPLGTKYFTVTATDLAGHTTVSKVSYEVTAYTWAGFGPPITISQKDFKKTSTIPVKFQLLDTFRNPVSNAIARLTVNDVPAVASGSSNIGNSFRYDLTGQQYIFNLSTKLLSLGINKLIVTLDDGTTQNWFITLK